MTRIRDALSKSYLTNLCSKLATEILHRYNQSPALPPYYHHRHPLSMHTHDTPCHHLTNLCSKLTTEILHRYSQSPALPPCYHHSLLSALPPCHHHHYPLSMHTHDTPCHHLTNLCSKLATEILHRYIAVREG